MLTKFSPSTELPKTGFYFNALVSKLSIVGVIARAFIPRQNTILGNFPLQAMRKVCGRWIVKGPFTS